MSQRQSITITITLEAKKEPNVTYYKSILIWIYKRTKSISFDL